MKLTKKIAQIALVLSALPMAALAGDAGTIYTQISTNGLGLGYAKSVGDNVAVRGQINSYSRSFTGDVGDFGAGNVLDVKLSLNSVQVLGDWYPSAGAWRLSAGLVFNDNKVTLAGTGNVNNKPATVNGEVKLSNSVSPYLGVGYSTRPKDAKGFGFNFDLGVMFQDPTVSLTATGVGVTQADIDAQKVKMQDAVDQLKNMPVIGVGVSYAF